MGDLGGRQCYVAIVPSFNREDMMSETGRVIAGGAGAIWIPMNTPPLGVSPAHPQLEPFWALAEDTDTAIVVHIDADPIIDLNWQNAPELGRQTDTVLPRSTYFIMTQSFAAENFLGSLVIGGVFERHPRLRFGIIECGAQWLGPLVERVEMVWDHFPQNRKLSKRPTQYVEEQVRVSPFFFEPIDVYALRFGCVRLADCYKRKARDAA
jgi:predicted TIM-barrel fold metal-dependent hydrolase